MTRKRSAVKKTEKARIVTLGGDSGVDGKGGKTRGDGGKGNDDTSFLKVMVKHGRPRAGHFGVCHSLAVVEVLENPMHRQLLFGHSVR